MKSRARVSVRVHSLARRGAQWDRDDGGEWGKGSRSRACGRAPLPMVACERELGKRALRESAEGACRVCDDAEE